MVDYTDDFSKKSENSKKSEATHSNTQGGSTLKRSASYIMLKNTCNNFRNKSLSKNKNDECESQKNETTENSRLNSKSPSKKLSSQNITASHQRIVSRIHKHNSDHMINPSQRETYFNAKRPGQIETNNVFELKKEEYEEESPLEQALQMSVLLELSGTKPFLDHPTWMCILPLIKTVEKVSRSREATGTEIPTQGLLCLI